MFKWFKSLFAWKEVSRSGVWSYRENSVTGERTAVRIMSGGYSPVDRNWLYHLPETELKPPSQGPTL